MGLCFLFNDGGATYIVFRWYTMRRSFRGTYSDVRVSISENFLQFSLNFSTQAVSASQTFKLPSRVRLHINFPLSFSRLHTLKWEKYQTIVLKCIRVALMRRNRMWAARSQRRWNWKKMKLCTKIFSPPRLKVSRIFSGDPGVITLKIIMDSFWVLIYSSKTILSLRICILRENT